MAKKKEKSQIINNIQELNLEIDYDKLAEAIAKANKKDAAKRDKITTRGLMVSISNILIYGGLLIGIFHFTFSSCIKSFQNGDISLFACIFGCLTCVPVLMFLYSAFQETLKDTEEEALSHFQTNISVAALIVALVALFKGVG